MTSQVATVSADLAQLPDHTAIWGEYVGMEFTVNDTTITTTRQLTPVEARELVTAIFGPDYKGQVRFVVSSGS